MVSLRVHITLHSLLSLLPLSARSLTIQPIQLPQIITPGAQGIIAWQRNTGGPGSKDPDNWHFEFFQNGAQIGSDIPVPHHAAASGTMTLTVPLDATADALLQLFAVDGQATTAFAGFPGVFVLPTQPPTRSFSTQSKDSHTDSPFSTASSITSNDKPSDASAAFEATSTTISDTSTFLTISVSSSPSVAIGGGTDSTASGTDHTSLFTTTFNDNPLSTNMGISGDATATAPITTTTAVVGNHHSNRTAVIADSVIGTLIVLLLLMFLYCFWRRRGLKRQRQANNDHTSFRRDMMIRNSDTPILHTGLTSASLANEHTLKLKDFQRKVELLSRSVGGEIGGILGNGVKTNTANEKGKVVADSYRISSTVSSTRSSTSDDETTLSLAMGQYSYSSAHDHILEVTQEEIKSPALTTLSSETPCSTDSGSSLTSIPIPALTERQMNIQAQIMDLQQRMIGKSRNSSARELHDLWEEIKRLEKLNKTDWALELTDVLPLGLGSELGMRLGQRRSSVGVAT
ncbi:hypothetical protein D9758_013488 [Tetrapyrgos nigripes]|uniref:Uncharacterized protein n=1 Tax=Tetrapyrgos nigripes TaxID=182062 RepID=A0A8H5FR66_9AGAR|nr:hypothetical protein D9758_013488 [Tetrapyrgos nigripes]